jgi:hypothetical protein
MSETDSAVVLRVVRRLPAWLVLAALLALPGLAMAQGSPGPMSLGHKDLTAFPVDCNKCHEAGFGVPDDKCLACHTHQPLRARIRAGQGFHASDDVKKKKCKECHAEHKEEPPGSGKGRKTIVDWKPFGGQRNFNHRLTGWPLDGQHRYQKCEKCHDKEYPETKLTTYLGLREECTTCHEGTKEKPGTGGYNPHKFTDVALTACQLCHTYNNWKVANLGATKYDHDKTAYPLVGNHLRVKCMDCHQKNIATFKVEAKFEDCKACHEDSHRSVISATKKCNSCHNPKVDFKKTNFDHGKETKFALHGQHAKNRCKDCHKIDSKPEKPGMACVTCHQDVHQGRFGKETCEGCHVDLGWKQLAYDHDKKTKFELTGKHEATSCTTCHRFGIAEKFERFKTTQCGDCHAHQEAHCGQFGMENCERCHVQGGDRTSKFDHALTRFPLERAHAEVGCNRCHLPTKLSESPKCTNSIKYTGLDPECVTCHQDVHKGELGTNCKKCHTAGENFKTLVFDHNKDSQFALTGFHQLVDCAKCHPGRKFKIADITCFSCHQKDDVHLTVLGRDCAKCHETTGGAPKFDHNLHTEFERTGVHAQVECARCHFLDAKGESPFGPAPGPDGGVPDAQVADSGAPDAGPSDPFASVALAPPGAKVDLLYRSAGKDCAACHPDPHQVKSASRLDCGQCHGFEAWPSPPKNDYHQRAGFSLDGAHTVVACNLCHDGSGSMKGRGDRCGDCHRQDDIHAGSFGAGCDRCHQQNGWLPTTFTHNDTGYVLQGLHRVLECRQCHQAGAYFIGNNCYNCHLSDFRGAEWHQGFDNDVIGGRIHISSGNGAPSHDCSRCHNQFTWSLGSFFDDPNE